jgi:hypothetical protein
MAVRCKVRQEDQPMSASDIARRHFTAALAEAKATGQDADAVTRQFLSLVTTSFLERRPLKDVRAELIAAAAHADPDEDFAFMRP